MLRGFRWQFILLTLAIVVFMASALFRLSRQTSQPQPEAPKPTAESSLPPTTEATEAPRPNPSATASLETATGPSIEPTPAYREGLVGTVRRLNPLFAHLNPVDRDISSLVFEGLFATNDYGEVVPRLAEQLVISADGIAYVVKLREDIRWQDGTAFSADDVVYTMSLLSDTEFARFSPDGAFWATVETQKLNEYLLRFRLAQPLSSFPHLLTIGILPEHALRGTTISQLAQHPFNLSPIGTGPFQLAALQLGADNAIRTVELARSPIFLERQESQGSYSLTRLSFHLYPKAEAALAGYKAGVTNALANLAPRDQLLDLPHSQVYTQVAPSIVMLIFNWKETSFAERRLRQALSLSLDVPALVARRLGAEVAYADSPYTPGSSVYLPHSFWRRHDIAQARALLEAAAIFAAGAEATESDAEAGDHEGSSARFSLLIEDEITLRNLAADIATQWRQLGLELEIEAVGADEYTNRLSTGRFETAIVALPAASDFDLYRHWHPAQYGSGQNYGAASNHEVAELIEKARREIYSSRRAMLYQQLQDAFAEEAIAIPLFYRLFTFVVSDQIEGVQVGFLASPADRFRGIGSWRMAAPPS